MSTKKTTEKLQYKKESKEPDSEHTRQRLLQAGLEVFARAGYNAATTRQICQVAQANISAIPYYFGSKEGLYRAVVEHISGRFTGALLPTVEQYQQELKGTAPAPQRAKEMLKKLVAQGAELIVGAKEAEQWAAIISREQMEPTFAFDILYQKTMKKMLDTFAMLVGAIQRCDPKDTRVKLTIFNLLGQFLIFRISRTAVLKYTGWKNIKSQEIEDICSIINTNIDLLDRQMPKKNPKP